MKRYFGEDYQYLVMCFGERIILFPILNVQLPFKLCCCWRYTGDFCDVTQKKRNTLIELTCLYASLAENHTSAQARLRELVPMHCATYPVTREHFADFPQRFKTVVWALLRGMYLYPITANEVSEALENTNASEAFENSNASKALESNNASKALENCNASKAFENSHDSENLAKQQGDFQHIHLT